ncbi:MAG: hypothetical protein LC781_05175 [Actinobacteria bacterium]|nr:hypothetical protein [Actinomycetota bacterium]
MGTLGRRLERLEARAPPGERGEVSTIGLRVLCTAVERHRARAAGRPLPPYASEEVLHLREMDIEIAAGGGLVAALRESPGWQADEAQEVLDGWEHDARRRLARAEELGEEWARAYQEDDETEGEV